MKKNAMNRNTEMKIEINKETKDAKRKLGKKERLMKGVAIALVLSQVLLLPMMALASEENPRYHENYYALLSAKGELKQGSVVRQYEARGMQTVTDYGKYSSIKNLSNGVDAESDGERHIFHFPNGAPETLYIEGETTEPFAILPWKINISYELNGLTVDPSVLAGEKGLVKIHVDFTRNPDAQDYAKKNYVLIARANFSMEDILSLKAEKAEVVTLGEKKEVMFVLLPGEEDSFDIEVGSNSFSFDGLQFQMMPLRSAQVEKIKDIQDSKKDVEDSYHALKDAGNDLLSNMESSRKPLRDMEKSLNDANASVKSIQEEGKAFQEERDKTYDSLDKLTESLTPVNGNLSDLTATIGDTKKNIDGRKDSINRIQNSLRDLEESLTELRSDVLNTAKIEEAKGTVKALNGMLGSSRQEMTAEVISALDQKLQGNPLHDTIMNLLQDYSGLSDKEEATKKQLRTLLSDKIMPQLASLSSDTRSGMSTGIDGLSTLEDSLEEVKTLQSDLTKSATTAEELGKNANVLLENSQIAMQDLTEGLRSQDNYLRGKREETYKNLERNLDSASSAVRQGEAALGSTKSMQTAKDTMEDLVESKWEENTGEKTNLFEMDPDRAPESLVSGENENIVDVAVTLRTEEIQVDKSKEKTKESDEEPGVWEKIAAVFAKMFSGLGKLFKGGK